MSILVALLVFAVLFLLFISLVLFVIGPGMLLQPYRRTLAYYRKHTSLLHPADCGLSADELTVMTAEGIPLSCWFIPPRETSCGTVVILHGVSESKIAGIPMAQLLHLHGFTVVLYDSRRHGDSGGRYCTYGFYEKHDPGTIINFLEREGKLPPGKIGLFGASMGAAVALQSAAIEPRIAAVAAESGFATLRAVFDEYQKRMIKLPFHYLRNIVIKRSEILAHFRANAVSPLLAVRDLHIPILLVHGGADANIPSTASEQVFANANPPRELWIIPGARHDNMWDVGGEEYRGRVIAFFERHLAGR